MLMFIRTLRKGSDINVIVMVLSPYFPKKVCCYHLRLLAVGSRHILITTNDTVLDETN